MSRGIGDNGGPSFDGTPIDSGSGWVRVERDIRSHHLVGFGKSVSPADSSRGFVFSRAEAWLDLIMECRYAHGEVINKGRRMKLEPGQLLGAISWLAHRWNWTPKQVRTFLDNLEADNMVERYSPALENGQTTSHFPDLEKNGQANGNQAVNQKGNQSGRYKGNQASVISVCNYAIYQMAVTASMTSLRQPEGQPKWQPERSDGATEGQPKGNTLTKEQEINNNNSNTGARTRGDEVEKWDPTEDAVRLADVLTEAAGACLDNPVNCSGLLSCAAPIAWIRSGCDLDADIIPTLKGLAGSAAGRRIRTWDYFTNAVLKARDRRLAMGVRSVDLDTVPAGEVCEGVSILDDGSVKLSNGVEQEWLRRFGGNAELLDAVLVKLPSRLRPPSRSGVPIKQQIFGVLGEAHENHIQRKQNTIVSVEHRARMQRGQATPVDGQKVETEYERTLRMLGGGN